MFPQLLNIDHQIMICKFAKIHFGKNHFGHDIFPQVFNIDHLIMICDLHDICAVAICIQSWTGASQFAVGFEEGEVVVMAVVAVKVVVVLVEEVVEPVVVVAEVSCSQFAFDFEEEGLSSPAADRDKQSR